jgi:hypothetical protein
METQAKLVLHPYSDKELWYAEAEDGIWRLPLFCEWVHDKENDKHYGHLLPAVCLYYQQALTLKDMLDIHDIQGRDAQWVVPRRIVEAILHKAPGITPLRYYVWPGEDAPPIDTKPPIRTGFEEHNRPGKINKQRVASFVEWLAKDTKIASSIINAVLNAVAEGAPTWLVEHRRPLDLGFCRIVAVPFRGNWKEIVTFKAKAQNIKLRTLFKLPTDDLYEALEDAGLPEILTSPHNVGLRRGWKNEDEIARIDYSLEAIATVSFESAVNRIEGKRMARGPAAYVAEFEDAVEAIYESAIAALRSYLKKVAMPFSQVFKSSRPGFIGFLPIRGRKVEVRNTPLSDLPVRVIESGSRFSVFGRQSDQFLIQEAAAEVQAVPAISSGTPDMRERTVDGDFQLVGDTGTSRVLLQNEHQGCAEGGPVLASSTPAGDGMDGTGDNGCLI